LVISLIVKLSSMKKKKKTKPIFTKLHSAETLIDFISE